MNINETTKTAIEILIDAGYWFWFDGNSATSGQWIPGTISRNADERTPEQQRAFNILITSFCDFARDFAVNAEVTIKNLDRLNKFIA